MPNLVSPNISTNAFKSTVKFKHYYRKPSFSDSNLS